MLRLLILSTSLVCSMLILTAPTPALAAKPSDAEKARKAAEKKLDTFEKTYDPSKDLSRKNPEKLEKDIAEIDEALAELKGLDAAAGAELTARRDAVVSKAKEGVSSAAAGKSDENFNKHYEKMVVQFDPEKKKLENVSASDIKRAKEDLDRLIEKMEPSTRKPYEEKRDAFFVTLQENIGKAGVGKRRSELTVAVPEVKPLPGIEAIAPLNPTWCEGVEKLQDKLYSNYHVRELGINEDASNSKTLMQAVIFSCVDSGHDLRQKWVASFRQQLSNNAGISAATNERLMKMASKLVVSNDIDKQQNEACAQYEKLATGTLESRYSRALDRVGIGCSGRLVDQADGVPMNAVDVPGGVGSQLAGAVLANRMTTEGFHSEDGKLTGFAVANAVLNFDAATFEKELVAMKLNDVATINAVMKFYGMAQKMKVLEVQAKARNANVLLDAPKKGAQAFVAALSKNQASIDEALMLDDQKRTGTLKGCAEKLYPQLADAIKGNKESIDEIRLDGLLAYKLSVCAGDDVEAPQMAKVFGYYSNRTVAVRGPFTAAYLALLSAHNAASGNGASAAAAVDPRRQRGAAPSASSAFVPDSNPIEPENMTSYNGMNPENMGAGPIVKAVEKKGALTKIIFRTEHYMVPIINCVETGKIDRINSDGTIVYRKNCKIVGEEPATSTNEPITVPTWAANGVSAGNMLIYYGASINDDVEGQPHRGWIVESYESKAKKKRTSLFGIAQ